MANYVLTQSCYEIILNVLHEAEFTRESLEILILILLRPSFDFETTMLKLLHYVMPTLIRYLVSTYLDAFSGPTQ